MRGVTRAVSAAQTSTTQCVGLTESSISLPATLAALLNTGETTLLVIGQVENGVVDLIS